MDAHGVPQNLFQSPLRLLVFTSDIQTETTPAILIEVPLRSSVLLR